MTLALPLREKILDLVAARLATIQAGDTYFTSVATVHRKLVNPANFPNETVLVVYSPSDAIVQREGRGTASGIVRTSMNVEVIAWFHQDEASDTAANLLAHDIEKCMGANRQWLATTTDPTSGLAYNSYPIGREIVTQEGGEPYAALTLRFVIEYQHDYGDPSQQR